MTDKRKIKYYTGVIGFAVFVWLGHITLDRGKHLVAYLLISPILMGIWFFWQRSWCAKSKTADGATKQKGWVTPDNVFVVLPILCELVSILLEDFVGAFLHL
jgi:hypothetical protein